MVNRANALHGLDPEPYPRTGRMYFDIDSMKFERAIRRGEARGRPVKVLYHSHLDVGAYFSPRTRGREDGGGRAAWDLAYLVTSVRSGEVDERKLFVWSVAERAFVEAKLGSKDEIAARDCDRGDFARRPRARSSTSSRCASRMRIARAARASCRCPRDFSQRRNARFLRPSGHWSRKCTTSRSSARAVFRSTSAAKATTNRNEARQRRNSPDVYSVAGALEVDSCDGTPPKCACEAMQAAAQSK